jgi:transposase
MLTVEENIMIKIMYNQGFSMRQIATKLGVSRNTVKRHLACLDSITYANRNIVKSKLKLTSYEKYIKDRIDAAKPNWIPATVIFNEILEQGYQGSLSLLSHYMYNLKPKKPEEKLIRFETEPGEQMQVDWAAFGKKFSAFIAILGYSRLGYVEFVDNEKIESLLHCHENAFDFFEGVPKNILYDNMKTVVIDRNKYGINLHKFNPKLWDFAKRYNFVPTLCKPYRAKTKGKVERFIHYLRYSFYNPLISKFKQNNLQPDLIVLNNEVVRWLKEQANQRVHATTGKIPYEAWQLEKDNLQSMPLKSPIEDLTKNDLINLKVELPASLQTYDCSALQHSLEIYDNLIH